jgi:hypothetical protein
VHHIRGRKSPQPVTVSTKSRTQISQAESLHGSSAHGECGRSHTYATSLINSGMSLQALMALLGHVTEMTRRYARGAGRPGHPHRLRRSDRQGPGPADPGHRPRRPAHHPGRIEWLRAEMLKTRLAHGYCSRQLAAEACPYANICEQCNNYVTAPEFIPQLQAQFADVTALRDDAARRGWHTEVARHSRVITSLQAHLQRLIRTTENGHAS